MKQLSTRTLAIIALVTMTVFAVVVFTIQNHTKPSIPAVENGDGREDQESQGGNMENEEELVWYEIPELGVRFKVSPDVYEDLKYKLWSKPWPNEQEKSTAVFYYQSEINYLGKDGCFNEEGEIVCTNGLIVRVSRNKNFQEEQEIGRRICRDGDRALIEDISGESIACYHIPQASNFTNERPYSLYKEKIKDQYRYSDIESLEFIPEK